MSGVARLLRDARLALRRAGAAVLPGGGEVALVLGAHSCVSSKMRDRWMSWPGTDGYRIESGRVGIAGDSFSHRASDRRKQSPPVRGHSFNPGKTGTVVRRWHDSPVSYASAAGDTLYARPPIQVIAHRGASEDAPEHTLAAYRKAIEDGADALECDVRLTADGHLVCVHDRRVNRTSNGRGAVSALELAELAALDFGSWKDPTRHRTARPPLRPPPTRPTTATPTPRNAAPSSPSSGCSNSSPTPADVSSSPSRPSTRPVGRARSRTGCWNR